ncbi:Mss4-like protein [Lophiotrema nucula]|uniref:Mss4-like protein n=1 Tax=Lophiotrema nucula TaxID=690887 RepID=A0A6A5YY32_9PLEO|nr:Mss4-like protein [Lophiotrema nucula]
MPPTLTGDPKSHPNSSFIDGLTGTCLCGSITVTIKDQELFTKKRGHLCHCSNCRKSSGSFVAANLAIDSDVVEVKDRDGTLKTYDDYETGSGKKVERVFCARDGNPIMSVPEIYPGKVVLKMGIFPRIPAPEMETFSDHRHAWQGEHDGLIQYATVRGGKKFGEKE